MVLTGTAIRKSQRVQFPVDLRANPPLFYQENESVLKRITTFCRVQCSKCGWSSSRRIQTIMDTIKGAEQSLKNEPTYPHLKCTGKVFVKRVVGSHVIQ